VQVGAVEAFSTLMLMAYAAFLGMTYKFRNTLLPDPMASMEAGSSLPPAQSYSGGEAAFAGNGGFTDASIGQNPPGVL